MELENILLLAGFVTTIAAIWLLVDGFRNKRDGKKWIGVFLGVAAIALLVAAFLVATDRRPGDFLDRGGAESETAEIENDISESFNFDTLDEAWPVIGQLKPEDSRLTVGYKAGTPETCRYFQPKILEEENVPTNISRKRVDAENRWVDYDGPVYFTLLDSSIITENCGTWQQHVIYER